jgi:hypothetical protein
MVEPVLDMHKWETERAQLEEAMEESPREALPEVRTPVTRMLRERDVPLAEVVAPPGDVGAAFENSRLVYQTIVAELPAP